MQLVFRGALMQFFNGIFFSVFTGLNSFRDCGTNIEIVEKWLITKGLLEVFIFLYPPLQRVAREAYTHAQSIRNRPFITAEMVRLVSTARYFFSSLPYPKLLILLWRGEGEEK